MKNWKVPKGASSISQNSGRGEDKGTVFSFIYIYTQLLTYNEVRGKKEEEMSFTEVDQNQTNRSEQAIN